MGVQLHLLGYLVSSDSEDDFGVRQVRIEDRESRQQYANVQLEGFPAHGIIDTGSDITIMGIDLFKKVAAVPRLRKSQFQRADKTPRTYDGRTFSLDGRLELDISFNGRTMKTPVYVKVDATEQLLLGEGACRQLHIVMEPSPSYWRLKRRDGKGEAATTTDIRDNNSAKKIRLETTTSRTEPIVEEVPRRIQTPEDKTQLPPTGCGDAVVPECVDGVTQTEIDLAL